MKDQEKKITNKEIFENKQKKVKKIIDPKHQQEQEELFAKSDAISPVNKKIDNEEIHFINGTKKNGKNFKRRI